MSPFKLVLLTAWLMGITLSTQGQVFEHLNAETYLFPQGSTDGKYFKASTPVKLNAKGEVIVGTLARNAYLFPQGLMEGKHFLGGTQVEFNSKGEVVIGTLASETYLFPRGSMEGKYFGGKCPSEFNSKGEVVRGALSRRAYLFPVGSTQGRYFRAGCLLDFNSKGEVISGVLDERSYLFPVGSMEGKYFSEGTHINFSVKSEVSSSQVGKCDCSRDLMESEKSTADLKKLMSIISGAEKNYDRTVMKVLERNNWADCLTVVDVTASMYPYAAQVYLWLKLNSSKNRTRYYVFFNDGDGKRDSDKVIGRTGGLYGTGTNELSLLLKTMSIAMSSGNGGDVEENDIEAILYGLGKCGNCRNVIHIADNKATPRDMSLLRDVNKPVRVIACGVDDRVNPKLMDIAYRTGGSFHTIEEDIVNLSGLSVGETIRVSGHTYKLGHSGFYRY